MSHSEDHRQTGWMVGWQPAEREKPGRILVAHHPDYAGKTNDYLLTSSSTRSLDGVDEREQAARLIGSAFQCVVDGVPVADVLREFSKIPEWHTIPAPKIGGWVQRATRNGMWNPYNP